MSDTRKDPCKKQACAIQKCLKENNFQESACFEVLELMRECCRSLRKDQKSICCEGISLDPVDPANKSQSKKK